jgi:hypothetical protein
VQPTFSEQIDRKRFFEFLGFSLHRIGDFEALMPAPTDVTSPEGLQNRAQFLRIWVELGAFLTYFIAQNGQSVLRTLLLFIILGVLEQTVHLTTAAVESGAPFWVRLTEYAGTESVLALHPFHSNIFPLVQNCSANHSPSYFHSSDCFG